jgi:hypothetical protein
MLKWCQRVWARLLIKTTEQTNRDLFSHANCITTEGGREINFQVTYMSDLLKPKLLEIIFKNSDRIEKETQDFAITNINH